MADINIGTEYRFQRVDTGKSVIVLRGLTAPTLTQAGGRWNVIARPRRTDFITYEGSNLRVMDVPIMFDGWAQLDSIEEDIDILNAMRLPPGDLSPPPQVRCYGALPVTGIKWVITNIEFGDIVIWHEGGYRLRQDATVTLTQYEETESLEIKPPATSRMYNVAKGDTLKSISKDQYGTSKYWRLIQKANNIRDPKKLPKKLRLPVIINP